MSILPFSQELNRLRLRWIALAVGALAWLWGGYQLLTNAWLPVYAMRWLALAALIMGYILWMVWQSLKENIRSTDQAFLPYFGLANGVSLARGLLIAAVAGFLFSPRPPGWLAWLPGLLYTTATLLDFVDGYLARRLNQTTRLGEILDMNFDGLGVLSATLLVVLYRQVQAWYLLVGLARYLFLAGLWLRQRLGLPVFDLPPDPSRRAQAGLQMGYIFVMLWPLFSPPGTYFAAILFSAPFLTGFLWDWFTVCGVVQADQSMPGWAQRLMPFRRLVVTWLPLPLRLGLVALMLSSGLARLSTTLPAPLALHAGLLLLEWLVLGMIALGAAGRVVAILGLILLGVRQIYQPLSLSQYVQALLLAGVLYLGTGLFSLWKPEDWLIFHRAGERIASTPQPALESVE